MTGPDAPAGSPTTEFVHRCVPPEGDGSRALLLLHGTGGDEADLLPLGRTLAPGAALLSPRGRVLENGMPRFFRRLAEGVFDREDLVRRTHELADFVTAAAARYDLPARGLVAVGFSNGANIAASMMLLRPEVLAGAILLRAMVPLEPETLPDLRGVEVLIRGGRADRMIPPDQPERLAGLLARSGAGVTLGWSPGGHGLSREDVQAGVEWLDGGVRAPTGRIP